MDERPTSPESASAAADFDFSRFVARSQARSFGGDTAARYAYSADIAMLRAFRRMRPVELAVASVVRLYKNVMRNQMLGTMIKVGPKQFPSLYRIAEHCAFALSVPVPTIYVAANPVMNAYTFGSEDDSFIVVHSAMVDHFTEEELRFVIGHETGHIQNKHVVYGTVLQLLKSTAGMFLRWVAPPAELALQAWYRRAEITCDRAGLLCCGSLEVASRTFLKMACGSRKLYDELDVESYLAQLEEGRQGLGRFSEAFASHPYMPKRVEALRTFAESALYREAMKLGPGGLSMAEVDAKTSDIIQILRGERSGGFSGLWGRGD